MASPARPLKPLDGGIIKSVDAALYLVDEIVSNLVSGNLQNNAVFLNLVSLVNYLTNHGTAVEAMCREQLDRAFVHFRKSSWDDKLDYYARRLMLYLVEMRANNWVATESLNRYFKTDEYFPQGIPDNAGSSANTTPALQSPTLPLLGPGETIKSSGKYLAPTKIPVNPGAKERLVQVTGPDEAHINYAQQLMGDTIRRNASPVPFRADQPDLERVGGSSSSVNSSASDESTRIQGYLRPKLHHSQSTNDATQHPFNHTVKVGGVSVKISGSDYSLVMPELTNVERPVSAFAAFTAPTPLVFGDAASRKYSRFALCSMAKADICKEPPANWEAICPTTLKPGATKTFHAEVGSQVILPKPSTTIPFRPEMFTRSKSEPAEKNILAVSTLKAQGLNVSKELPNTVTQDNEVDIIFQSPLSLQIDKIQPLPGLPTLGHANMSFPIPIQAPFGSPPPSEYSPRSLTSPASNYVTPPLSPLATLPAMNRTVNPEAPVVVRTTIPFRPKLTNPKLNLSAKK